MGIHLDLLRLSPARLHALSSGTVPMPEYADMWLSLSETCHLGKSYDALFYMLDSARARGASFPSTPQGAAVKGWHELPVRLEGNVLRFNTPEETADAADALDSVDIDSALSRLQNPEVGLYNIPELTLTRNRFDSLRSFYRAAEQDGHAVLVSLG